MSCWISISIYKMKSGKYFILDIPEEMKELGYKEECYEEDSHMFAKYELKQMDNEEHGFYQLVLELIDKNMSFNKFIKKAKNKFSPNFTIESFKKIC